MIESTQLWKEIIRPVLQDLRLGGILAEALVLGTACQESHCGKWLTQLNDGPARGIYQMEPRTHEDIWINFLANNKDLATKVSRWRCQYGNGMGADEMVGNLYYATAMCRIHYLRVREAIPSTLPEQAEYWKKYYNTHLGAGNAHEYMVNWRQFAPMALLP